jgi:3-phosphoshikimate 1-carboxyvinyltransferase
MTIDLMARFGVGADWSDPGVLRVEPSAYNGADYTVEPDASNATYFLAAAAVSPGSSVTITGLGTRSLQGDASFAAVLERMGASVERTPDSTTVVGRALHSINVDMTDMPDAAMTLAVVALFAEGPTTIRGLHTLPLKETDRLSALKAELSKLGAQVEANGDSLRVTPTGEVRGAEIETYDDHRMAMSFAVAGTRVPGITIVDPDCVGKTYPGFWQDLESLRG